MLREYQLTNFKAFGEKVTIPIRPLTLIFGANSSGKSSIFQSLLLLKQTLEEAKNPHTALLPKGSLVDLGSYKDFVHRHETERHFEFWARFDLEIPLFLSPDEKIREAALGVLFTYSKEALALADPWAVALALNVGDDAQKILEIAAPGWGLGYDTQHVMETVRFSSKSKLEFWGRWWNALHSCYTGNDPEYRDLAFLLSKNSDGGHIIPGLESNRIKERLRTIERSKIKEALCSELEDALQRGAEEIHQLDIPTYQNFLPEHSSERIDFSSSDLSNLMGTWMSLPRNRILSRFRANLESLIYLGPLRNPPKRVYEYSGDTTEYAGQSGEHLPSILFENPDLLEKINADLERLGVQYVLKLSRPQHEEDASLSNVFSLRLLDKNTGTEISLRDVGFGISQVLPIVAQAELCEKKTLLIEQPEIHLHPAHQAELGDLFIRSAKKRGNPFLKRGNTFLLETHSEHLLLRILRRIRETTEDELPDGFPGIRPEDVAVLYVEPGEKGARVIEIPVTEDGEFDRPWPQGFFPERAKELF